MYPRYIVLERLKHSDCFDIFDTVTRRIVQSVSETKTRYISQWASAHLRAERTCLKMNARRG